MVLDVIGQSIQNEIEPGDIRIFRMAELPTDIFLIAQDDAQIAFAKNDIAGWIQFEMLDVLMYNRDFIGV